MWRLVTRQRAVSRPIVSVVRCGRNLERKNYRCYAGQDVVRAERSAGGETHVDTNDETQHRPGRHEGADGERDSGMVVWAGGEVPGPGSVTEVQRRHGER